jgi:hypothetical protein
MRAPPLVALIIRVGAKDLLVLRRAVQHARAGIVRHMRVEVWRRRFFDSLDGRDERFELTARR